MMKYALLAGAMMIAGPALAQTTPATGQPTATAPAAATPAQTAAPTSAPVSAPQAQAPTAPTSPSTASTTATAQQPTQTTGRPAAAGASQVAQVVDREFPTYDANKDGNLSSTEFDAWMVALKKSSDPNVNATAPETVKWNQAAFAQADTDKNKSVSKAELTTFLSKAAG